jgi:hypothetical protein
MGRDKTRQGETGWKSKINAAGCCVHRKPVAPPTVRQLDAKDQPGARKSGRSVNSRHNLAGRSVTVQTLR